MNLPGAVSEQWPTPTVTGNTNKAGVSPKAGDGLATAVKQWPTPRSTSSTGPCHHGEGGPDLQTAVLWSTPIASEVRQGLQIRREGKKGKQQSLTTEVVLSEMWPTPTAAARGSTSRPGDRPLEKSSHLQAQVQIAENWATPNAADGTGSHGGGQGRSLRSDVHGTGGVLNPEWVENLMGFPPGWTFPAGLPDEDANSTRTSRRASPQETASQRAPTK